MHRRPFLNIAAYTYLFTMLALLFVPLLARAQALPSGGFPYTQTGNAYVFTGGTTTAANAASLTFANPANGAVYAQAAQSLPLGGGYTATVQPRAYPASANVAKALTNFASKIATPLVVGVAIYDFARELGFGLDNTSGVLVVTVPDPNACPTSSSCAGWYPSNAPSSYAHPDKLTACNNWARAAYGGYGSMMENGGTGMCHQFRGDGSYVTGYGMSSVSLPGNTGQGLPSPKQAFEDAIAAKPGWPSGSHIGRALGDAVASGEPLAIPAPAEITGPLSVPGVPRITNFPDGSKTTVTPEKQISYGPGSVTVTDREVTTQTSPGGVTTPVQDTAAPAPLPAPVEPPEIQTCGLPGKPACKIDEAGTPSPVPGTRYDAAIDSYKQEVDDKRAVISGSGDKTFFNGWSMFFAAPPPVQCEPLAMPTYLGVQIQSLDPCPVADGMRTVMGYIWALVAMYLCLRMIRGVA